MRFEVHNDRSGEIFSKKLIDIGYGKIPLDALTDWITFTVNFCQFTESITELIQKVFPNIAQNYRYQRLSERDILAAKNKDINEINFKTENKFAGELKTCKSVDCANNQDDVIIYPLFH